MQHVQHCKHCMNYILRVFFTSCSTDMYFRQHQEFFCREQWNMITFVITAIYLTTKWQINRKGSSWFFLLLNYVKLPFLQQKLLFQSCVKTSCNRLKFSKFIFKVMLLLLRAQWLLWGQREKIGTFLLCINYFYSTVLGKKQMFQYQVELICWLLWFSPYHSHQFIFS